MSLPTLWFPLALLALATPVSGAGLVVTRLPLDQGAATLERPTSGQLTFLGFGPVYAGYIVVKVFVILGAHCAWRWDEPLYRVKALRPLMWVVERTISTPATHWAHHALTNTDGVGHYKGNFGNFLFLWDVLLGSAHITRRYPEKVGLQDDLVYGQERWYHQMFFPLLQSKREHSALRMGGRVVAEEETRSDGPAPQQT